MSAAADVRSGRRTGVLVACTVGNAVSMTPAIHAVFGTFLVPLTSEFGWPRAAVSSALTIVAVTGAIIYPLAGWLADRAGTRAMLIAALGLFGVAVGALSLGNGSLLQFYATFLVISIVGSVASTPIYSKVIAEWYDRGRGTALGISAGLGNGLGSVLFPIIAAVVITQYGWRAGYAAVGVTILLLGLPVMLLLLRDAPRVAAATLDADKGTGLPLPDAMRLPHFWVILVAIASGAGCTTAIFSHVVPILLDRGYGLDIGTTVLSVFALTTSAWQIATGRLLDKVQTPRIVIPMVAMAIVGLALLEFGSGTAILVLGGILLGIGMGSQYGTLPYYIARYFGTRSFGTIIGVMYSAVIVGQGITPVLLDHAHDVQGSYRLAVVAACGVLSAGAALLLLLPRYAIQYRDQPLSAELGVTRTQAHG